MIALGNMVVKYIEVFLTIFSQNNINESHKLTVSALSAIIKQIPHRRNSFYACFGNHFYEKFYESIISGRYL